MPSKKRKLLIPTKYQTEQEIVWALVGLPDHTQVQMARLLYWDLIDRCDCVRLRALARLTTDILPTPKPILRSTLLALGYRVKRTNKRLSSLNMAGEYVKQECRK